MCHNLPDLAMHKAFLAQKFGDGSFISYICALKQDITTLVKQIHHEQQYEEDTLRHF